jgi:hypothetical protein
MANQSFIDSIFLKASCMPILLSLNGAQAPCMDDSGESRNSERLRMPVFTGMTAWLPDTYLCTAVLRKRKDEELRGRQPVKETASIFY